MHDTISSGTRQDEVAQMQGVVRDILGEDGVVKLDEEVSIPFFPFLDAFGKNGNDIRGTFENVYNRTQNAPAASFKEAFTDPLEGKDMEVVREGWLSAGFSQIPSSVWMEMNWTKDGHDALVYVQGITAGGFSYHLGVNSLLVSEESSYRVPRATFNFDGVTAEDVAELGDLAAGKLEFNGLYFVADENSPRLAEVDAALRDQPAAFFRDRLKRFYVGREESFALKLERRLSGMTRPRHEKSVYPVTGGFESAVISDIDAKWARDIEQWKQDTMQRYKGITSAVMKDLDAVMEDDSRVLPHECKVSFFVPKSDVRPSFAGTLTYTLADGTYTTQMQLTYVKKHKDPEPKIFHK